MGFEHFQVELRGGRATFSEAHSAVLRLPHVRPDGESIPMKGAKYYIINDGQHAIEVEVMESPVRLSCRFTLCHPRSVDSAFLGIVRELMMQLGMEAKICDDVRPEQARPFSSEGFDVFSSITSRCIATRRTEWMKAFGTEPLAATTNEVYQRIILPRCQPAIAQPT